MVGAYLSNNKNKIILYPSKYCHIKGGRSEYNYFYPDNCIKINIEP